MRTLRASVLIAGGVALLLAWVYLFWWPRAPLLEPVNLDRTSKPSVTPWMYDHDTETWEYRLDRWKTGFMIHGLPALGLVSLAAGLWMTLRRKHSPT